MWTDLPWSSFSFHWWVGAAPRAFSAHARHRLTVVESFPCDRASERSVWMDCIVFLDLDQQLSELGHSRRSASRPRMRERPKFATSRHSNQIDRQSAALS